MTTDAITAKSCLDLSGYACEPPAFRFNVYGRQHDVARVERDQAVAIALNILGIAALFGGLTEAERARLAALMPTPAS